MFTLQVDLGQVLLGVLIGVIGYLVKRQIDQFDKRIEKHENVIFKMASDLQYVIGFMGIERRKKDLNNE